MLTTRNKDLIVNACKVYLQPVGPGAVWQDIYSTPSSIRWSSRSRITKAGNEWQNKLEFSYPGIGRDEFKDINQLVNSNYALQVGLNNQDVYEIADALLPARCDAYFRDGKATISFESTGITPPDYLFNLGIIAVLPQLNPVTIAVN
ncbi:hypothetical protein ACH3O9_11260 [Leeuwenhoekiella sp. A16]|uniref:hypothetical protein n=1 Tax=Leeuwenhoekiella sp. A16 TaxID=3141462 RepID=UPI003A80698E